MSGGEIIAFALLCAAGIGFCGGILAADLINRLERRRRDRRYDAWEGRYRR